MKIIRQSRVLRSNSINVFQHQTVPSTKKENILIITKTNTWHDIITAIQQYASSEPNRHSDF
jgi:hypothetical protein